MMDAADLLIRLWAIVDDKGLQRLGREEWERFVREAAEELATATEAEKAGLRERMDVGWARLFWGWGRKTPELAVNMSHVPLLPLGLALVALSHDRGYDSRDSLALVPLYRRAAELLDLDEDRLFDSAAAMSDRQGARWVKNLRRTGFRPENMGYTEVRDEDGFRFVQF